MTESTGTEGRGIRITLEEIAGAVGDFGTIFPIMLGVAIVCPDVNVSHFFLFLPSGISSPGSITASQSPSSR